MKNTQLIVYFDMDDVLFDLRTGITKYFPETHNGQLNHYFRALRAYSKMRGFEHQNPTQYKIEFEVLFNRLKEQQINMGILTSRSSFDLVSDVIHQKVLSLESKFPETFATLPLAFTESGNDKKKFAHSGSYLVDDTKSNCEFFRKFDGGAFHFVPSHTVMSDLNRALDEWIQDKLGK